MRRLAFPTLLLVVVTACGGSSAAPSPTPSAVVDLTGLHKIQHVVVIMQENRSFDQYFGTYPGADGLPRQGGQFTVCVPDPVHGGCTRPYHDPNDKTGGGPHGRMQATEDINGGKMDGFIAQAEKGQRGCVQSVDPNCTNSAQTDVMGYKDAREIPNYWAYAQNFVLQDHLFQPNASWSFPQHLYMVSEWAAKCSVANDPMSCVSNIDAPGNSRVGGAGKINGQDQASRNFAWTSLTYLLYTHKISGATTSPRARSLTARTTPPCVRQRSKRSAPPTSGTRCPGSPTCGPTANCRTYRQSTISTPTPRRARFRP